MGFKLIGVGIFFVFVYLPNFVFANTVIDLPIFEDTVWTKEGSPYVIEGGDIVVMEDTILTIEEGVEIQLPGSIVVFGSLFANGTQEENGEIKITGTGDGESWGGFFFDGEEISLSNISATGATGGLTSVGTNLSVENADFSNWNNGIYLEELNAIFDNVEIYNWSEGVTLNNTKLEAKNINIDTISSEGFLSFGESELAIEELNFINSSGYAGILLFDETNFSLKNSIFSNFSGSIIEAFDNSILNIENISFSGVFDHGIELFNQSVTEIKNSIFTDGFGRGIAVYHEAELSLWKSEISEFLQDGLSVYNNAIVVVEESELFDNNIGVGSYSTGIPNTIVSSSLIYDNFEYGIANYGNGNIEASNNWWGDATGPMHSINEVEGDGEPKNPEGLGDKVFWTQNEIIFTPWRISESGELDPVIIVPGMMGSWFKGGEWVLDPILHVYDDLVATLEVNDYDLDVNLFTFPYEWRNSNVLNAINLRYKIDEVKEICECDKVDLVTHSMGGLLAREYVQSDKYQDDVDQLIFLGTPHLGAPESYLNWGGGAFVINKSSDFKSKATQRIFNQEAKENGFDNLFDYIHQRPISSLTELLPVYPYLKDMNTGEMKLYSGEHPENEFLENLNSSVSNLLNSNIRITNIVGELDEVITIEKIRVVENEEDIELWKYGKPDNWRNYDTDQGLERGIGDGTVPLESASFIDEDVIVLNSEHKKLVDDSQEIIYKKLTGKEPSIVVDNKDKTNYPFIIIRLFSPVDMNIVAPDGTRLGVNFETGEEYDEIPNSFYSGNDTNSEFAIIFDPIPGEYKVETIGTGEGEYNVSVIYSEEEDEYEEIISGNAEIDIEEEIEFIFSDDVGIGENVIEIKEEVIESSPSSSTVGYMNPRLNTEDESEVLGVSIEPEEKARVVINTEESEITIESIEKPVSMQDFIEAKEEDLSIEVEQEIITEEESGDDNTFFDKIKIGFGKFINKCVNIINNIRSSIKNIL